MNTPKKKSLTIEAILEKISEFDIFKMYISDLKIGRAFCSPVRNDTNPSAIIYLGNDGKLRYKDFTESGTLDCVDLVMKMFFLDYDKALHKISNDFGLGLGGGDVKDYKKIINSYSKPIMDVKRYSLIQVSSKKYTTDFLKYWADYYQDSTDLRRENVYQVKEAWLNRKKIPIKKDEICIGYLYDESWKLYFPLRSKSDRFISNVPLNRAYGLHNLSKDKNALITKSHKDYMVALKVFPYSCGVQSENVGALNQVTMDYIKANSKKQYLNFDSDPPGKKASLALTSKYSILHFNVPDSLLLEGENDISGWSKKDGLDSLRHYLKCKKVII